MSAVTLDRRLVLEARTRTPDGAGGYADDWQPLGVLWASLHSGAGGLSRSGDSAAETSATRLRITVRAAPPGAASRPAPGQRFRAGDRNFAIEAVAESRAGAAFLTCHCREEISA